MLSEVACVGNYWSSSSSSSSSDDSWDAFSSFSCDKSEEEGGKEEGGEIKSWPGSSFNYTHEGQGGKNALGCHQPITNGSL